MKQELDESWDFIFFYFSNNPLLATIQFRMQRLNSPMMRCRISAGIDMIISWTCSLTGMTVTVTKERCVEIFQIIIPEGSPDISSESCVHTGWSTGTYIEDAYGLVEESVSWETDLAEVRIHLAPTFTRSELLTFLSLGLHERLYHQKKFLL